MQGEKIWRLTQTGFTSFRYNAHKHQDSRPQPSCTRMHMHTHTHAYTPDRLGLLPEARGGAVGSTSSAMATKNHSNGGSGCLPIRGIWHEPHNGNSAVKLPFICPGRTPAQTHNARCMFQHLPINSAWPTAGPACHARQRG